MQHCAHLNIDVICAQLSSNLWMGNSSSNEAAQSSTATPSAAPEKRPEAKEKEVLYAVKDPQV